MEIATVRLRWTPATDKDITDQQEMLSYRVELSRDKGFSGESVKINTQNGAITALPADLDDNTLWYWRVRAFDDNGAEGPISEVGSFVYNSGNDPPEPVSYLIEPADGEEVTAVGLNWRATTDPDPSDPVETLSYKVELSPEPNFRRGVVTVTTEPGITTTQPIDLADNTRWFWRVRAVDTGGAQGAFSPVRSLIYNTANDPPDAFQLLSPANGAVVEGVDVTLHWRPAKDPDPGDQVLYTIHIAGNSDFTTNQHRFPGISGAEFSVPGEIIGTGGAFYWKVSADDGEGGVTWGSNSDERPWSFTVKAAP